MLTLNSFGVTHDVVALRNDGLPIPSPYARSIGTRPTDKTRDKSGKPLP